MTRRWLERVLLAGGLLGLLLVANALLSPAGLWGIGVSPYYSRMVLLTGINVVLAVSLNLVNGFTGQFSIGHAGFMAVGAYTSAYFTVYHGAGLERTLAVSLGSTFAECLVFALALALGAVVGALAGVLVGIPSLRLRGDYLAIVTLGFAEIIRIVIVNIDKVGGATGFSVPGYTNFVWVGGLAILTIVAVHNIVRSDTGRAMVSIREDEIAAEAMGIDTTRYKVLAFTISSAFAGVAGVLFGHYTQFLSTNDFQFIRSFEIIIMVVLGGMGSITGSVLGALIITLLPELLREFAAWRLVIYSAILILVMLTRPQGILGHWELRLGALLRRRPAR